MPTLYLSSRCGSGFCDHGPLRSDHSSPVIAVISQIKRNFSIFSVTNPNLHLTPLHQVFQMPIRCVSWLTQFDSMEVEKGSSLGEFVMCTLPIFIASFLQLLHGNPICDNLSWCDSLCYCCIWQWTMMHLSAVNHWFTLWHYIVFILKRCCNLALWHWGNGSPCMQVTTRLMTLNARDWNSFSLGVWCFGMIHFSEQLLQHHKI